MKQTNKEICKKFAELHLQEIGDQELSGRLDFEFIYAFYSLMSSSKYSKIFYKTDKAGNILS